MKRNLTYPLVVFAVLAVACANDGTRGKQKDYETVQEGSASGVTSTIHGPGEVLPPITDTNADTTSAFTLDPNAVPPPAPGGGAVAGTMPPMAGTPPMSGATPSGMSPASPAPQPRPAYVPPSQPSSRPAPAPAPQPTTTQPTTTQPTTTQPAPAPPPTTTTQEPPPTNTAPPPTTTTQEPAPPPPAEEPEEEEEEPPPPTTTDTRGQ